MLSKHTVGKQMLKKETRLPSPICSVISYLWYSYSLMCTLGDLQSLNYGGGGWRGSLSIHVFFDLANMAELCIVF